MIEGPGRADLIQDNIPVRLGLLTRGKQLIHDFCSQVWVVKLCRYLSPFRYQRENAEKILRIRDMFLNPVGRVSIIGGDTLTKLQNQTRVLLPAGTEERVKISVTLEDSVTAAFQLKEEEDGVDVAILNMANRWQLGGVAGNPFCRGSQEEALFRASDLRASLSSEQCHEAFATAVGQVKDSHSLHHIPYFGAVLSEHVSFIHRNKSQDFTVISAAAPDMRKGSDEYARLMQGDGKCWEEVMKAKIQAIFEAAIQSGAKKLVLGAFGCGCFANDPKKVASLFKEVIGDARYKGRFSEIVFAIKGSVDDKVYRTFKKEFGVVDHGGAEALD